MPDPGPLDLFRNRLALSVRDQRFTLLVTGVGVVALGVAAVAAPLALAESVRWSLGIVFILAAVLKAGQWVVGKVRGGHRVHGLFAISCHVLIDLFIGCVLIFRAAFSVDVLAVVVGVTLVADGLVQILVGVRLRDRRHRVMLYVTGGLTCGVAVLAAYLALDADRMDWLAYLVALKLFLFGGMLIYLALTARGNPEAQVYGAPDPEEVRKIPGEAYAVFIGNSFHLGVYVGNDRMVDFRDTNLVYEVTWEQFLIGRRPQHWEYPDLPACTPDEVCRFALDQVGKTHPYNFLTFNCEHFTIWCKTLGKLRASRFAQVNGAFDNVAHRPILGTMVELYSRIMEFVAFKFGGAFGRRASLWLRENSALVGRWILAARVNKQLNNTPVTPTPDGEPAERDGQAGSACLTTESTERRQGKS